MGFFDSKSSTTQTTINKYDTDTTSAVSEGNEGQNIAGVSGSQINVLDGGAIVSAFDYARESQAMLGETFSDVLGLTRQSVSNVSEASEKALAQVSSAYEDSETAGEKPLYIAGGLLAVGFIAYMIWGK